MQVRESTIQLSHPELLLLLGLLRLPLPLALGEQPLAGYTEVTLNAALAGALSGLLARDYLLAPPSDDQPPALEPAVRAAIEGVALAPSCLMIARRAAGRAETIHYYFGRAGLIRHSSPQDEVHRLETLVGEGGLVDEVLALAPLAAAPAGTAFAVGADALQAALEGIGIGQFEAAKRNLTVSGVAEGDAETFVGLLSGDCATCAFAGVRRLSSGTPELESLVTVGNDRASWRLADSLNHPGQIDLTPIDQRLARQHLERIIEHLREDAVAPR